MIGFEPEDYPQTVHEAAIVYGDLGLRVIPIAPGTKFPRGIPRWQEVASSDRAVIDGWWRPGAPFADYGVGIATGPESGVFVLDIDVANGKQGMASLEALQRECGGFPKTVTARTGTLGIHIFFKWPLGVTIRNDAGMKLGLHIDVRALGGQVLAVPTLHPNGTPYQWVSGLSPFDVDFAPAPEKLIRMLCEEAPLLVAHQASPYDPKPLVVHPDGERPGDRYNHDTNWAQILEGDGWQRTTRRLGPDGEEQWTRPGKEPRDGCSATVGYKGSDVLKVFSTSIPELEVDRTYDRFSYYAQTRHGGDLSAAARALLEDERARGVVTKPRETSMIEQLLPNGNIGTTPTTTNGSVAAPVANSDLFAPSSPRSAANGHTPPPPTSTTPAPTAPAEEEEDAPRWVFKSGATFVLDDPADLVAVWGEGDQVLWASGEALLIVGPPGVGKSTLAIQLLAGRLGLMDQVLGFPVQRSYGKVLYLAMDRPRQIRRAMRRIFGEEHRDVLHEHLVPWEGPPPADFGKDPSVLLAMCEAAGAQTVFLDSLKDAAVKLTDDEVAGNVNRAIQSAHREGIEIIGSHHQRKGQQGGGKPKSLDDVYGSTWITAGAGSVILLWGAAGDRHVELSQLKPPAEIVGPLALEHDHQAGITRVSAEEKTAFDYLAAMRGGGLTSERLAVLLFGEPPDERGRRNDRDKAYYQLEKLVRDGRADKHGGSNTSGGKTAAMYVARYREGDMREMVSDGGFNGG